LQHPGIPGANSQLKEITFAFSLIKSKHIKTKTVSKLGLDQVTRLQAEGKTTSSQSRLVQFF